MSEEAIWREEINSLAFRPVGHGGFCVVHRLAFRALVAAPVSPGRCQTYFRDHRAAFERAARVKAGLKELAGDANFHLTSRDLRRALAAV